jgi:2-keto-4-pentenoate hydratase/2-oxohepta-3-ene-1,7-dioic acid hydratase in catechol pathway
MMHKPAQILAGIQEFMKLEDGDIIMTGTPRGVGQVQTGDRFVGRVIADGQILISQEWQAE